ncbi:MAG TPA: hypothetical protein VNT76_18365, partial [Candidatus Binatus sp.]|nr:hypothetical protein [Candidatus Binatus sp.]
MSKVISAIFLPNIIPPGRRQGIGFFRNRVVNIKSYRSSMQREDTSKMTTKKSATVDIDQTASAR